MSTGKKRIREVLYQCKNCDFVLRQSADDPPPPYCPNCAVNHLRGEMVLVFGKTLKDRGPGGSQ